MGTSLNPAALASRVSSLGNAFGEFVPPPDGITFNFDQGVADEKTFPLADLERLGAQVAHETGPSALHYIDFTGPWSGYQDMAYGHLGLREALAAQIQRQQGRSVGADGVLCTSGSVQAIDLAVQSYLNPGEGVVVEASTFGWAVKSIRAVGGVLETVPLDDDNINPDDIEARFAEFQRAGVRPKLIYAGLTFQAPTGTVMPADRRRRLLEVIQKWGVIMIEDNVYYHLNWDGLEIPTLFSMDDSGLVLQTCSFSKSVMPGIRLGWVTGTPAALAPIAQTRNDLGVSQWLARIMQLWLQEGSFDPHIARIIPHYRHKRDAAVAALREHCGDFVQFRVPQGSFYVWVRMADGIDWPQVQQLAFKEGIYFRPGERFTNDPEGRRFFRMSFALNTAEEIDNGLRALGGIMRQCSA
jgi:2-aminoadipate transaminase